jgi:hypothetical protein
MVRILKSMPMVVMNEGVKLSSLKRSRQQDLPTPESPMRSSLICGGALVEGSSSGAGRAGRSARECLRESRNSLSLPSLWRAVGGLIDRGWVAE